MPRETFTPFGELAPSEGLGAELTGLIGKDGLLSSRYRLISKLGKGGMGEVFLAEHVVIQKRVAIKILLPERARDDVQKRRFLTEARATARIHHPNVIEISDFGETPNGRAFFVMEYLAGEDLKTLLRREQILPWDKAAPILLQLCSGLAAAHGQGIIHRDLKPDNVYLIECQGVPNFVKILDFGLAKMLNEPSTKKLTKTGIIVGTPAFIAPEQIKGEGVDHRVDLYALGLILYRMLCGRLPFRAKTVVEMLRKHMREAPLPPSQLATDAVIPPQAEAVTLRCLKKDPKARFESADALAKAIAQVKASVEEGSGAPEPASNIPASSGASAPFPRECSRPRSTRLLGSVAVDPADRRTRRADPTTGPSVAKIEKTTEVHSVAGEQAPAPIKHRRVRSPEVAVQLPSKLTSPGGLVVKAAHANQALAKTGYGEGPASRAQDTKGPDRDGREAPAPHLKDQLLTVRPDPVVTQETKESFPPRPRWPWVLMALLGLSATAAVLWVTL